MARSKRGFTQSQLPLSHAELSHSLILALLLTRLLKGISELISYPSFPVLGSAAGFVYVTITYLITAILIWQERARLPQFHISKLAVILFIVSKPFQLLALACGAAPFLSALDVLTALILVPVALALLWAMQRDRRVTFAREPGRSRWLLISLLLGVGLGLFAGYLITYQSERTGLQMSSLMVLLLPALQLTNAATHEEPLFRGFLWGYLREKGWREVITWLVQAGLFLLGHIVYVVYFPVSFWIIVPIMGLVFGLIAWRARDIAPAMIAHGLVDGVPQVMTGIW